MRIPSRPSTRRDNRRPETPRAFIEKIAERLARCVAALGDRATEIMRHVGGHDLALDIPGGGVALVQVERRNLCAKLRDQLFESLARRWIGPIPDRRAHKAEFRRDRPGLGEDAGEIRRRERPRIGIRRIVAGDHVEEQRGVGQIAREHADMVEACAKAAARRRARSFHGSASRRSRRRTRPGG